ncbi:MAG: T9SS C-terminal target domain-containing protein, partial [Cytophagia bacterium]|nr:T9SS C-terminal target domain-containing protein [Cytophagia bacterium]
SNSIAVDPLGNVFVSGTFQASADFDPDKLSEHTMISEGDLDGFVLKLDSNGEFLGSVQIGGFNVDYLIATVNTIGHVCSTGFFTYTVDFDPMGGTMELQSKGYYDSFVLMMSGDLVLGIEEADEKGVNAFPNPVSTVIKIVVEPKLIGYQFNLFDLRGNKVRSGAIVAATTPISVDDLQDGIYFIQVMDRVYKIVKQ